MTAILLLPHDADREEWLKRRRDGVGASEIAAVMGISPWESPFSMWWRKHMGWEYEASLEMKTGTFLENTIADWFAEFCDPNEELIINEGGLFASGERAWQLATPDRLLKEWRYRYGDRGPLDTHTIGLLECKWVAYSWDGWGEDGSGEIPVHYRAQVLWQMDVMETEDAFVCALGPGGFRVFRIYRDEKDLRAMREAGRRFMESLTEGEPPNVDDHTATLPTVRRLHAAIDDTEQEIPQSLATGWLRSKRFKDLADRVERRYSARMRAHMGTAKTAVCNGTVIAARTLGDQLRRKA